MHAPSERQYSLVPMWHLWKHWSIAEWKLKIHQLQTGIKILTRRIHFSKWDRDSAGFLTCKVRDWIFEAQSVVAHSWSTFRCCVPFFSELINMTLSLHFVEKWWSVFLLLLIHSQKLIPIWTIDLSSKLISEKNTSSLTSSYHVQREREMTSSKFECVYN